MKVLYLSVFLFISSSVLSQTRHELYIDSVCATLSDYINANIENFDSAKFVAYAKQIAYNYEGATDSLTDEQRRLIPAEIMFRLVHHNNFMMEKMMAKISENEYFTHFSAQPPSSITREECASFWNIHQFTYHNADSTLVHLTLNNNYWIDRMEDGTYSKLTLDKFNDQTFNICFVGSNNPLKALYSIPGDIYCYQLLEKTDHSFKLSTHIEGLSSYEVFELNY